MDTTLVLYSDRASPVLNKAVEKILAVDDLHAKTNFLIFNTYATELKIPNTVNRRFTDRRMMTRRVKDLLDGVGGMFMYHKPFDYSVLLIKYNSAWSFLIQWMTYFKVFCQVTILRKMHTGVSMTLTLECTPACFYKRNVTFTKLGTNDVKMMTFLYALSETSDVLWYGVRRSGHTDGHLLGIKIPNKCPSVRTSVRLSVRLSFR